MILKTKEERVAFLRNLKLGESFMFYMIRTDEMEALKHSVETFLVQWAWNWDSYYGDCKRGELSLTECRYGDIYYDGSGFTHKILGVQAIEYVENFIWADDRLELEAETKAYKEALSVKEEVLQNLL